MIEVDYLIANWSKDKRDEVATVKRFLDNSQRIFAFTPSNIECYAAEPIDIWVKDIDKKFQIVVSDFEHYELLGKAKADSQGIKVIEMSRSRDDVWRESVVRPILKKGTFGRSANGITLLLNPPFDPPFWVEEDARLYRASGRNKELKQTGWDEIYLVCKNKNIYIYP